jgi:beta-mannosidase
MFDPKALWPDSPAQWELWQFSDFQPKNTFDLAKVQRGRDIGEFVRNTQRYQSIVIRYSTELFRRRKWTKNTGIYHFMFTDDWPSITWSVVDYYRRPKLGYEALKSSMRPLLPSIEYDPHDPRHPIAIWIVNDVLSPVEGAHLTWRILEDTKQVGGGEKRIDVAADASQHVVDLGVVAAMANGHGKIEVSLESAKGEVLARSELAAEDFLERPVAAQK